MLPRQVGDISMEKNQIRNALVDLSSVFNLWGSEVQLLVTEVLKWTDDLSDPPFPADFLSFLGSFLSHWTAHLIVHFNLTGAWPSGGGFCPHYLKSQSVILIFNTRDDGYNPRNLPAPPRHESPRAPRQRPLTWGAEKGEPIRRWPSTSAKQTVRQCFDSPVQRRSYI